MCDYMSEFQIETMVERKVGALDRVYMKDDFTMTKEQYDEELQKIDQWAEAEYAKRPKN